MAKDKKITIVTQRTNNKTVTTINKTSEPVLEDGILVPDKRDLDTGVIN